ncbi:MAG: 50S ribosomal protein L18 [Candidatus Heimdallarchaeota archaeon]|nr:50S ribosomal protein L18 [Candidatus Heimdallarchaeota archaeon]
MAKGSNYSVPFRRRREGKTNFHRRQRLLRSFKPRLVIRRSNKHERAFISIAKRIGDETMAFASSKQLKDYGWKGATGNLPTAYLTGYLAGKYAQSLGIEEAIIDLGINSCRKGTRIAALICGAVASGLEIPHNPKIFPSEERYTGQHIANFAELLKEKDPKAYDQQFSGYKKDSAKPEKVPSYFEKTVKNIDTEFDSGDMKTKLEERRKSNQKKAKKKKPTKKAAPKKKAEKKPEKKKPAKKQEAAPPKEIKVTYKDRTYTIEADITEDELKSKRGIPRKVKEEVAEKLGYELY